MHHRTQERLAVSLTGGRSDAGRDATLTHTATGMLIKCATTYKSILTPWPTRKRCWCR